MTLKVFVSNSHAKRQATPCDSHLFRSRVSYLLSDHCSDSVLFNFSFDQKLLLSNAFW